VESPASGCPIVPFKEKVPPVELPPPEAMTELSI
jgi:hypothetical protein